MDAHRLLTCLFVASILSLLFLSKVYSQEEDPTNDERAGEKIRKGAEEADDDEDNNNNNQEEEGTVAETTQPPTPPRRGKTKKLKRKRNGARTRPEPVEGQEQDILDEILSDYDSRVRPNGLNITWADDVNMEYSCQVTFREEWVDQRLRYKDREEFRLGNKIAPDFLVLPPKGEIWMPDSFFQNEKQARKHNIDKPNVLIRIYKDGKILYSVRISLVLSCPMDLHNYPMDLQQCLIDVASYAYTTRDIKYVWKTPKPIQIKGEVNTSLPSFELKDITTGYCTSTTNTGTYSCLRTTMILSRQFSYYLLQLYIPSSMLVIVSWVSFWLDRSAVPARVTLGVTTLLTMTTQSSGINAKLPPVSYTKAIDIWIGVCLAFIFGALLEFACVTYVGDKDAGKRKKRAENAASSANKMAEKEKNSSGGKGGGGGANSQTVNAHAESSLLLANMRMVGGLPPTASPSSRLRALPRNLDDEESAMNPLLTQSPGQGGFNRNYVPPQMIPSPSNLPPAHMLAQNYSHFLPQDGETFDRSLRLQDRRRPSPGRAGFFLIRPLMKFKRTMSREKDRSKKIDYMSRLLFPGGFFAFNIIYWVIYKGHGDSLGDR